MATAPRQQSVSNRDRGWYASPEKDLRHQALNGSRPLTQVTQNAVKFTNLLTVFRESELQAWPACATMACEISQ